MDADFGFFVNAVVGCVEIGGNGVQKYANYYKV